MTISRKTLRTLRRLSLTFPTCFRKAVRDEGLGRVGSRADGSRDRSRRSRVGRRTRTCADRVRNTQRGRAYHGPTPRDVPGLLLCIDRQDASRSRGWRAVRRAARSVGRASRLRRRRRARRVRDAVRPGRPSVCRPRVGALRVCGCVVWLIPRPLRSSLSAPVSADLMTVLFELYRDRVLWVTSNGTPTPRRYSWRGWKTRPWIQRLFGAETSPSWTLPHFSEWTQLPPGSPVNRSRAQASGADSPTNGGSGRQSPRSFAQWDRDSCSWKTFPASRDTDSHTFSGRWPKSGSMRSGICSARKTWARRTGASGGSVWPTPTANDAKASGSRSLSDSRAHDGTSLTDAMLSHSGGRRGQTRASGKTSTPVLSPQFVEWLMGFPRGWTDCS